MSSHSTYHQKLNPIPLEMFRHYASEILSPQDLLARIGDVDYLDSNVLGSFVFHSRKARVQVHQLLEITSAHPVCIGELRQEGFDLDCIHWLAEKGLRRIVKSRI